MVAAIPSGDMHDVGLGLLIAVVAPIDMKARAIKMGKAGWAVVGRLIEDVANTNLL
jgi:hypothetical protein